MVLNLMIYLNSRLHTYVVYAVIILLSDILLSSNIKYMTYEGMI